MFRDAEEFARYMVANNIKNADVVMRTVTEIMKLPKEQQSEKLKNLTMYITKKDDLRMAWIELLDRRKGFFSREDGTGLEYGDVK